jgi:hypothetical protein
MLVTEQFLHGDSMFDDVSYLSYKALYESSATPESLPDPGGQNRTRWRCQILSLALGRGDPFPRSFNAVS